MVFTLDLNNSDLFNCFIRKGFGSLLQTVDNFYDKLVLFRIPVITSLKVARATIEVVFTLKVSLELSRFLT